MQERASKTRPPADLRTGEEIAYLTRRTELIDLVTYAFLFASAGALSIYAVLIAAMRDLDEIHRFVIVAAVVVMLAGIALVLRGVCRQANWNMQRRVLARAVADSVHYLSGEAEVLYVLPRDLPLVMDSPIGWYFQDHAQPLFESEQAEEAPSLYELPLKNVSDDALRQAQGWFESNEGLGLAREFHEAQVLRGRVAELSADAFDLLERVSPVHARRTEGSSRGHRRDE
jgi:hypothetical protein